MGKGAFYAKSVDSFNNPILLVDDDNRGDSKLERIRFTFPKEFRDRLPAPFLEIIEGNYKTEDSDVTLRNKISKIYKEPPANIKNNLYVENSLLKFDIDIFKLNTLDRWRQDNLEKYIVKEYRDSKGYIGKNAFWKKINIVKIIIDAFGRLKANQFVSSEGIDSIFQVIYGGKHGINLENILIRAADLGFLSKIILNNKNYYQSKNILEEIPIQAKDYLIPEDNKFLVEINKIPYKCLEQLACLCSFFLDNKKVYIAPDFSRLVKIYHTVKDTDLFNYLRNHSPLLNTKINEIEDKHGKVLLHSNLLIAKINDFKLKAIFAKTYADSNRIIFLPNNYIAFTQEECGNIKKLVVKSGLAVKNI